MEAYLRLMFWGNLGTALAYFIIATQLLLFVNSPQVCRQRDNQLSDFRIISIIHHFAFVCTGFEAL